MIFRASALALLRSIGLHQKLRGSCASFRLIFIATASFAAGILPSPGPGNPTIAQEARRGPQYLQSIGRAGASRYKPGDWGIVSFEIVNPDEEPAEVEAGLLFENHSSKQYARRLWVPPRSRRASWYSVKIPSSLAPGAESVSPKAFLIDRTNDRDKFITGPNDERYRSSTAMPIEKAALTGFIRNASPEDEEVYQCLLATRHCRNLNRMTIPFSDSFMPPIPEALDSMDQMLISSDRLMDDQAGIESVRRWVNGGGRLWIMLDQVSPDMVRKLLGDTFDAQIIDRTEVVSVDLKGLLSPTLTASLPEPYVVEDPIEMLRVLPGSSEVWYHQDGWPAAFWYRMGEGHVLCTTLGARGWMRPRGPSDSVSSDPVMACTVRALTPLEMLAHRLFSNDFSTEIPDDLFEDYVKEHVGYEIVGRGKITAIMGCFCGGLLICGLLLMKKNQLDRMAWIFPGAGIAVSAVIFLIGNSNQDAIPPTLAVLQLANASDNAHDVPVRGILAAYHSQVSEKPVGSNQGGRFEPDMSGEENRIIRFLIEDTDQWEWSLLKLPTGVRMASHRSDILMPTAVFAHARFEAEGLKGTLGIGSFKNPSDLLISVPLQGRVSAAITETAGNQFLSSPDDVLLDGSFLGDNLLDTEQIRRRGVYEKLLTQVPGYPERTTLFVWADPLDTGLEFPDSERFTGGALLALPLQVETTPPETDVAIPSAFLSFRSIVGPDGKTVSPLYNNRKRTWLETRNSTESFFEFRLPDEVLPIDLSEAELTIDLDASQRQVEILLVKGTTVQSVQTLDGPVGRFKVQFSDEILGDSGRNGSVPIGLRVSKHELYDPDTSKDQSENWQIKSIGLNVRGRTLPAE